MNKVKLVIVMFGCIFCFMACGKDSGENTIQIDEKTVSLEKVEINDSMHFMKRVFTITGKEPIEESFLDNIFPVNLVTNEIEWINDKTVSVTEMRFYEDEEECWKVQYGSGEEMEEYAFQKMEATGDAAKELTVDFEGKQISVAVVPYAVSINCEEEWMEEKKLYQVTAVLEDGSQQEICTLPFNKGKKMEERELLSLPYLGDGFRIGEEIKNDDGSVTGGKLIFWEAVDVDKVVDAYIY